MQNSSSESKSKAQTFSNNLPKMKPAQIKKQYLLAISIMALVVSVSLGMILPASTQVPPSSEPTSPCEIIIQSTAQKNAERDRFDFFDSAENKKKKSDDDRSSLSEVLDENKCTIVSNTWKIYDKKYDENKYPGWLGIIIAVGGPLLAIGKDPLQKLGKQLVEAIWNWFLNILVGTFWYDFLYLKKYRYKLKEEYKQFKITFGDSHLLEMEETYVSLKVAETRDGDRASIETKKAVQKYRRLMVKGAPGSGKSMLLKYLALFYAKGQMNLPDRPLLILLELNSINDSNLTLEQLEQELVKVCDRNDFPKANRFITEGLKHGRLMLLFDGLDEVSINSRSQLIRCLQELLKKYDKCRAIITCRTAIYGNEFDDFIDQTLEIKEFDDRQIRDFLEVWKAAMPPDKLSAKIPSDKSVERLINTLLGQPPIMKLAKNPLLLSMIAYLYFFDPYFTLPYSRAEFYTQATVFLLEDRDRRKNIADRSNQYRGSDKRLLLERLALYIQSNDNRQQQDRRHLTREVILKETKEFLPSLNIDPKEADRIIDEIVERSGLLLRIEGGYRFKFAHLTLQEYFAASAFVDEQDKIQQQKQDELIQEWQTTPSDWREVVKLWCGLAEDSTALIEAVYRDRRLTAFECLADAKEVKDEVAQRIVDYFKTQLGQVDNQLINAFGAVAAGSSSSGGDLFNFLVKNLDSTENIDRRKMAAQSLAMTNLPKAVEELAKRYKDGDIIIRESLVKMGNLAIPELKSLAEGGNLNALADLRTIATPEAAVTLVPFLWNSSLNEEVTYHSAWRLGELLFQSKIIEESLRTYPLTQAQKQSKYLDWIWKPFSEPSNLALPIIAGRIAYLLNDIINRQNLHEPIADRFIPDPIPTIDPRLMIPICSLSSNRVNLPEKFPIEAEALLERSELDDDLKEQIHQQVKTILVEVDRTWGIFILSLPPRFQLDLLYRLIDYPKDFNKNHWLNIYQKVKFNFIKSLGYHITLIVSFLISAVSIYQIFSLRGYISYLILPMVTGIAIFLGLLLIEYRINHDKLEPIVWLDFGILGIWRFFLASITILQYIDPYRAAAMNRPLILFLMGVETGTGVGLGLTLTMLGTVLMVVTITVAGISESGASFWVWGMGLSLCGEALEANANYWVKLLFSILIFPFFCWFPLVLCFTSLFLYNHLSWGWGYIILFWVLVIGLCGCLWQQGTNLAAKARNPLRGILESTPIVDQG